MIGCSANSYKNINDASVEKPDTSFIDSSVDSQEVSINESSVYDQSSQDDITIIYNACASITYKQSNYQNLIEYDCVDNYGDITSTLYYYDLNKLMICRWQVASDMIIRCLPDSKSNTFFYSDVDCSVPLAFISTYDINSAMTNYVSLSKASYNEVYSLSLPWKNEKFPDSYYYNKVTDDQDPQFSGCFAMNLMIRNASLYYVEDLIDPKEFTKQ